MWRLVGKTKETQIVQCAPKQPCPKRRVIVKIVKQDPPPPPPRGRKYDSRDDNDVNAVDNPDAVGAAYADDDGGGNSRDGGHQNRH